MQQSWANTWAIVQKELKHYFVSPIAYVVMVIFLTLSGYFFYAGMVRFSEQFKYAKQMIRFYQNPEMLARFNLNEMVIAPALFNMVFVFLFILPLIMMRSFAEEKRQGTTELLMTSPITTNQLLVGKFLGSLLFVLVLVVPTFAYQALLFWFSKPEWGPVFTGYVGVILFASAGVAVGLFASSLTENQIIAAVISFVILLFMFIINFIGQNEGTFVFEVVKYLSVAEHIRNLLRGLMDTRDVVYFLSFIVVFLFLTKRSIESTQWR
ncbi:MAG TPA: ABC transporter permease subunit [Bdellovibrionota bacterium]|nr:ABC transporter permease subunit [Bdellovibrionota bacterium]